MHHSFEVLVDIKEYEDLTNHCSRLMTARYEVDADTQSLAHDTARNRAKHDYPKATEYDVTVTRLLC
jgi:hypothetical protein